MSPESRSKDFYGRLLLVAVILVVVPWLMVAWESSTGLTVARRSEGQIATARDLASTRKLAIGCTFLFGPVAVWCFLARRTKE